MHSNVWMTPFQIQGPYTCQDAKLSKCQGANKILFPLIHYLRRMAKAEGKYSEGLSDLIGRSIKLESSRDVWTDPGSKLSTVANIFTIDRGISFAVRGVIISPSSWYILHPSLDPSPPILTLFNTTGGLPSFGA